MVPCIVTARADDDKHDRDDDPFRFHVGHMSSGLAYTSFAADRGRRGPVKQSESFTVEETGIRWLESDVNVSDGCCV